jgi:hypothetical protein
MDAQDRVYRRFPDAEARQEPGIYKHGEKAPVEPGYWAIFSGPDFDANEIGQGRNEARAWSDAARKLEEQAA